MKIVKKGQPRNLDEALQELEDGELGDAEAVIMWEVHVLRELERHDHIVRLMDVVDLVDSTYIVMGRDADCNTPIVTPPPPQFDPKHPPRCPK